MKLNKKVLVLEDEYAVRVGIQRHLEANGCMVFPVATVASALEKVKYHDIDVFILDIEIGNDRHGGIHFVSKIETELQHLLRPVIFLTVFDLEEMENEVFHKLAAPQIHYLKKNAQTLSKPVNKSELIRAIRLGLRNFEAVASASNGNDKPIVITSLEEDIKITFPSGTVKVNVDSLVYVQSERNEIELFIKYRTSIKGYKTLKEVLEEVGFLVQIEKGIAVNKKFVHQIKNSSVTVFGLQQEKKLPVGPAFRKNLEKL